MSRLEAWATTFPRLFELYGTDPSNPNNYFNDPNCQAALRSDPPDRYLTELELILEKLDPAAWQEWKGRATSSHSLEDRYGYPLPLFDYFNEARAYVFLKQQGYVEVSFLKTGRTKVPDLLAKTSEGYIILLEAKRIRDSDVEIEYLVRPGPLVARDVCHGLGDALLAKLRHTVERAREQLLAFEDKNVRRRIVYLSIRIDSLNATQTTVQEIRHFLSEMRTDQTEILHFIENKFLL